MQRFTSLLQANQNQTLSVVARLTIGPARISGRVDLVGPGDGPPPMAGDTRLRDPPLPLEPTTDLPFSKSLSTFCNPLNGSPTLPNLCFIRSFISSWRLTTYSRNSAHVCGL